MKHGNLLDKNVCVKCVLKFLFKNKKTNENALWILIHGTKIHFEYSTERRDSQSFIDIISKR